MSRVLAAVVRSVAREMLRPRFRRFERVLAHPASAQVETLGRILRGIARSEYGRAYGMTGGEGYEAFRSKLPIVEYEDLRPWIERQANEGGLVLTGGPVSLYERTSGSSGAEKLIPYPPALLRSFRSCAALWAGDLLLHGPRLRTGRVFFSMSPPFQDPGRTPAGARIGLADDIEYFLPAARWVVERCAVQPPGITQMRDPAEYRLRLARALLAEPALEIVSIWSPTYLLALLDFIEMHSACLAGDLAPSRRALLDRLPIPWARVWPELKLLSCWTDAGAAAFVPALRERFPGVEIQGKGLLATEGPMTLPLHGAPAPVPLLDEVFLEFAADDGAVVRLHELRDGREYSVILTQAGGLARYRMHDRVAAAGCYCGTPCLRFLGRDNQLSDVVGEKLHEAFARDALDAAFGPGAGCAFLVPVRRGSTGPAYVCVTDVEAAAEPGRIQGLETRLALAFHYRQARLLGQLKPVRVIVRADARARYERHFLRRGMKWGNIKPSVLLTDPTDREVRALVG
ncbi:MAG: GH3 family domain-containing protein [Gemmatimonadales bacterium]